uniref:Ionotropic receptor Ir7w n=1 Tax=Anopheles coluzzii TaxID=1518534 RepID=A0A8F5SL88_ANOCL|nr:ionotropic receptor Ir7w [Anopheles coluzzii]
MLLFCLMLWCTFADGCTVERCEEEMPPEFLQSESTNTRFLAPILRAHYRALALEVHFRSWNGNDTQRQLTPWQGELIDDALCRNADWMIVSFADLLAPAVKRRSVHYSVLLMLDYDALCSWLQHGLDSGAYHFDGLYTIVIEQLADRGQLRTVMRELWNREIVNVVVVVVLASEEADNRGKLAAYSYDPYGEGQCGNAEPYEIGRYANNNGTWDRLAGWFPNRMTNLHGCSLTVGTVEVSPFSMSRTVGNRTVHYGLEVHIVDTLAARLNFTFRYVRPTDGVKWGILYAANSTGLVGLLQRREADFGFGSLGFSLNRHTYLRMGVPNHMTQMIMGIPPKRPYTSFEKLFQPFAVDAWLCIALGYTAFALVALALVTVNRRLAREPALQHPLYQLWVLLMGGAVGWLRLDSTRLFLIGFVLNALVIRTLFQAGLFQRLQSSESHASDFNTLEAINRAGLYYNMFRASLQFYRDNPSIPASRIKLVPNDQRDWDDLFYELSQDRLGGVMVSPLDCIAYYVKRRGKDGVVYVGKDTGFMYNLGFHYPKSTALQRPFDGWILRMHAAGLVHHWSEEYRDNRYWTNAKEDPEPASLRWNQISGGFYLCSALMLLATVVFLGEIVYFRLRTRPLLQRCCGRKTRTRRKKSV